MAQHLGTVPSSDSKAFDAFPGIMFGTLTFVNDLMHPAFRLSASSHSPYDDNGLM